MAYSGLDGDSSLISTTAPRNESQVMLCKRFGCHAHGFVSRSQGFWKAGALHAHEDVSMAPGTDPTRGGVRRGVSPTRLRAELHHFRAARIRVAGGGAGGDAPDALALTLGLPYGQPQPPKHPSPSQRYDKSRWSSPRTLGISRPLSRAARARAGRRPSHRATRAVSRRSSGNRSGFPACLSSSAGPAWSHPPAVANRWVAPAYAFVGAGQSGEGRMGLRLVPIGDAVVIVAAAERQVSIAVLDQEADRTAERDRVGNVPAIGRSQVLLGLKSRSLDLYSAPREFPMPFRSSRPPDAGPSFRPGARTTRHNRCSSRNERSVFGRFRSIGRLFTEGLSPPTRSSFLTKAGSSNPIVPELRASYQSCLQ